MSQECLFRISTILIAMYFTCETNRGNKFYGFLEWNDFFFSLSSIIMFNCLCESLIFKLFLSLLLLIIPIMNFDNFYFQTLNWYLFLFLYFNTDHWYNTVYDIIQNFEILTARVVIISYSYLEDTLSHWSALLFNCFNSRISNRVHVTTMVKIISFQILLDIWERSNSYCLKITVYGIY